MVPLEANLDKEDEDTDMVALLFQKVDLVSSDMIYLVFVVDCTSTQL